MVQLLEQGGLINKGKGWTKKEDLHLAKGRLTWGEKGEKLKSSREDNLERKEEGREPHTMTRALKAYIATAESDGLNNT